VRVSDQENTSATVLATRALPVACEDPYPIEVCPPLALGERLRSTRM
jgi:hypothetical protein